MNLEKLTNIILLFQWVPFVLFFQAVTFYVPHLVFKKAESNKIKLILAGLNNWVMDNEERISKEEELAKYIVETRGTHTGWCLRVLGSHCLYLFNVVANMWLTDLFLGREFSRYGVRAATFLEENVTNSYIRISDIDIH
jgi:hypothetical protein